MRRELVGMGKFLSLVLRHDPSVVGLTLDEAGWVDVDVLLPALLRKRSGFTKAALDEIVATNDKRRFVISKDGRRIRGAHSQKGTTSSGVRTPDISLRA